MMLIPDMAGSSSSREPDNLHSSLADMHSVIVPPLLSIFGLVRSTELQTRSRKPKVVVSNEV